MRSLRLAGSCVLAMLVFAVIATASASAAAPEIGRCIKFKASEKPYKGKFTDSGCTIESETETGQYEWHPGTEASKFTGTGLKGTWQTVGKFSFGCESQTITGEYSGTKSLTNVVLTFTGCGTPPFKATTPGHAAGEVQTTPLEGQIVWKNEAAHEAALDLFPVAGKTFTVYSYAGALWEVFGSILAPLKANDMSNTVKLKYKQKNGFQEVKFYEEGGSLIEDVLLFNNEGKGLDAGGWTITSTLTNEEQLEFNTFV